MMVQVIRYVTANQAYWLLSTVLPDGTDATDALQKADKTGANWGYNYHVQRLVEGERYDVCLTGQGTNQAGLT